MYEGCLIKQLTNIPCPSCGSTRAILSLLHGDVTRAFYWNPFGFIILGILFISPFWIIHDLIKRKQSLFLYFKEAEFFIRKKTLAIPLIMLVALNWFWNIYKGL